VGLLDTVDVVELVELAVLEFDPLSEDVIDAETVRVTPVGNVVILGEDVKRIENVKEPVKLGVLDGDIENDVVTVCVLVVALLPDSVDVSRELTDVLTVMDGVVDPVIDFEFVVDGVKVPVAVDVFD
jgi:hypothetical protein